MGIGSCEQLRKTSQDPCLTNRQNSRLADDSSFRIPEENREIYRITQQHNSGDIPLAFGRACPALLGI